MQLDANFPQPIIKKNVISSFLSDLVWDAQLPAGISFLLSKDPCKHPASPWAPPVGRSYGGAEDERGPQVEDGALPEPSIPERVFPASYSTHRDFYLLRVT